MSRLQQYQRKKFQSNIVGMLLLLVIILVFIFTFGIKLLLNASAFIANLTEEKIQTSSLKKNNDTIGDIDVNEIPVATNSSTIAVGGSVVNFNQLEFYLNGEKVKEKTLVVSDTFNEEITGLEKGKNEVYVVARMKSSAKKKKSKTFDVLYKSEKPFLEITEPQDNYKTSQTEIKLIGKTDKETFVRLNGFPLVVDAQGIFQTFVKLREGENKLEVTAQDVAGNTESKTLTVMYQKDE
ncbi:hypothetical protein HYW87_01130 [Candidatus Roizmanbacteria bacterium]|nr:hypothetical protein [Candidatus Roizmanbacteria bacterium]